MIYFDSAASYPVLLEVQQSLQDGFAELYGNSTASHAIGVAAHEEVEIARGILADEIGALKSEIIFTSGATESNNIAFKSVLLENPQFKNKRHIVTSEIEHKCILAICHFLTEKYGFTVSYVKPGKNGIVSKEAVEKALRADTALVSIMHVNNELGTINPIGDIGKMCFEKGVLFHSDAAQSLSKIPIDVDDLNVDLLSLSAHKIGGPKGIGAIYIRDLRNRILTPVIHGAGQEEGLRGGTVAAPLVKAFGLSIQTFPMYYSRLIKLNIKRKLIDLLTEQRIKFKVNGELKNSVQHIISVSFPDIDIAALQRKADGKIALAQGSACSSKQIEPSHVLASLNIDNNMAANTLRLSFSHLNQIRDLEDLMKMFAIEHSTNN